MKKFLRHMMICIYLFKQGFYFSDLAKKDQHGFWGFARFNFERGKVKEIGIFDIDFQYEDAEHDFVVYKSHSDFRADFYN